MLFDVASWSSAERVIKRAPTSVSSGREMRWRETLKAGGLSLVSPTVTLTVASAVSLPLSAMTLNT